MFGLSRLEIELVVAALLAAALAIGLHFYNARQQDIGEQRCTARVAAAQAVEHQKTVAESARNDDLASQLATLQASRKVTNATITKYVDRVVDRPVYRTACIDADGLRGINAALAGKADDPGLAASAVPAASAP